MRSNFGKVITVHKVKVHRHSFPLFDHKVTMVLEPAPPLCLVQVGTIRYTLHRCVGLWLPTGDRLQC